VTGRAEVASTVAIAAVAVAVADLALIVVCFRRREIERLAES